MVNSITYICLGFLIGFFIAFREAKKTVLTLKEKINNLESGGIDADSNNNATVGTLNKDN